MNNGITNSMLFFLVVGFCTTCTAQTTAKLSPEDFDSRIKNESNKYVILDVRTGKEVAQGKVPGAKQLDFYSNDFAARLSELDKNVTYYVYCKMGGRSGKTLRQMSDLGFDNVYDMEGGMTAWLAAGLEVE